MKIIKAVLFDFGGVLAEEGFKNGLAAIARKEGLNPSAFFRKAESLIYSTGYVLGRCPESAYWQALTKETGIKTEEADLRREILDRFLLRPEMFRMVENLKGMGFWVGILSDQTNWLEELDRKYGIFKKFDRVYNSYRLHISKRDPSWYADICSDLNFTPKAVLFIDDNPSHIDRATAAGLNTIHFQNEAQFIEALSRYIPL
jgi:putative hydrolase of the HAD superfamily